MGSKVLHLYRVVIFDVEQERVLSWDLNLAYSGKEAYEKSLAGHHGTVAYPDHKWVAFDYGAASSLASKVVVEVGAEEKPAPKKDPKPKDPPKTPAKKPAAKSKGSGKSTGKKGK